MKILHITKKFPDAVGGDAVVVSNLKRRQVANGHDVVVLTSNCNEIRTGKGIYKFGFKDLPHKLDDITLKRIMSLILLVPKSFKIIKIEKPDVIHTHSVDMAFFASFAARCYHVPVVHTFHIVTSYDSDQPLIRRKSELALAKWTKPAAVTAPNAFDVQKLIDAGLPAQELPNGIDVAFWKERRDQRKEGSFTFVSVGRLEEQKGISYLVKAAAILRDTYKTKFRVIIVGDGSKRAKLEELVASLQLGGIVKFTGSRSPRQIRNIFHNSNAFILPSLYETTPLTLLEAWAVNLPVIATRVGILKESELAKHAIVVELKDEYSLAKAMKSVMANKALRNRLSKAGKQALKNSEWQQVDALAEDIYHGAVA